MFNRSGSFQVLEQALWETGNRGGAAGAGAAGAGERRSALNVSSREAPPPGSAPDSDAPLTPDDSRACSTARTSRASVEGPAHLPGGPARHRDDLRHGHRPPHPGAVASLPPGAPEARGAGRGAGGRAHAARRDLSVQVRSSAEQDSAGAPGDAPATTPGGGQRYVPPALRARMGSEGGLGAT